jgi:hypothetical protein
MLTVLATLIYMASGYGRLSNDMDAWLLVLKLVALVTFIAAVPATIADLVVGWPERRSWFGKVWSINVAMSCVVLLGVAIVFNFWNLSGDY